MLGRNPDHVSEKDPVLDVAHDLDLRANVASHAHDPVANRAHIHAGASRVPSIVGDLARDHSVVVEPNPDRDQLPASEAYQDRDLEIGAVKRIVTNVGSAATPDRSTRSATVIGKAVPQPTRVNGTNRRHHQTRTAIRMPIRRKDHPKRTRRLRSKTRNP